MHRWQKRSNEIYKSWDKLVIFCDRSWRKEPLKKSQQWPQANHTKDLKSHHNRDQSSTSFQNLWGYRKSLHCKHQLFDELCTFGQLEYSVHLQKIPKFLLIKSHFISSNINHLQLSYTSNIIGTRGQQDDPRLSRYFSNANWARQPDKKGATETNAGRPIIGQVT